MIVQFARRGKGVGSGPVDYLLGKDRNRERATLNQGDPDLVQSLIDSSPYAKKYTSGFLCFAETDLSQEIKDRLMADFEKALLPGLDKDQYSILWVEHLDKGRLELNFVIPNIELHSGKRLQPYYHFADNPRIDAWRTIKNLELGLHDPDDPANQQGLVSAKDTPSDAKEIQQLLTDGLLNLAQSGVIRSRKGVIGALESRGFEITRVTAKSISIKNPESGKRNIRLKGLLYEQDFEYGEGLQFAIEEASQRYRANAKERLREARTTYSRCVEIKRAENHKRHPRAAITFESLGDENMDLVASDPVIFGDRQLRDRLVSRADDIRQSEKDSPPKSDPRAVPEQDLGAFSVREPERGTFYCDTRGLLDSGGVDNERWQERADQVGEEINDRARETTFARLRGFREAAQGAAQRVREALQGFREKIRAEQRGKSTLTEQCEQLDHASKQLDAAAPVVGKAIQQEQSLARQNRRGRGFGFNR
ncbi:relaxase/mobilization nuclease domain-containing protein [Vibrio parahaemolyticus]|nr:relaxase/mobilization nuclease domain-containing protein [Vibrio parahaemolyticus]